MPVAVLGVVKVPHATLLLGVVLLLAVFALDSAVGRELDLWLVYVIPIGLVSIVLGPRYGYLVACVATGLLLLESYLFGNAHNSVAALVFDRTSEFLAYLLFTFLIGIARNNPSGPGQASDSQLPPAHE